MVVRELDGTVTTYDEVGVEGDGVERLLTELFTEQWPAVTVGPLVEGAAYEIRFTVAPKVSDRKSTRLNSSHLVISYAVFCLKKKKKQLLPQTTQPTTNISTLWHTRRPS